MLRDLKQINICIELLSSADLFLCFDLNICLLQHKAIGIGRKFKNLDRPLPLSWKWLFKTAFLQISVARIYLVSGIYFESNL